MACNPIPTFVIDAECKIIHWNRACRLLTGIEAAKTLGTDKHREIFYKARREVLADLIVRGASYSELQVCYSGKLRRSHSIPHGYEGEDFFPILGENGKWLFFTAAPVRDANQQVVGAIETIQDITALRVTEQALIASESQYRQLFECANDGILILKNGVITVCNRKTLDILKRTRLEIVGLTPLDLSPAIQLDGEPSKTAVDKNLTDAMQNEPLVFEWRFLQTDGTPIDTEVSLSRFNVRGDPHTLAIVRDIRSRKEMMRTLEAREKELDEKHRYLEKVNLALKAALDHREIEKRAVEEHILVNLKRLVFPYIETLRKCKMSADASVYLNMINTNLNDIVSRLSTTLSSKYVDFTPSEIRVADLIREGKNTKEVAALLGLSPSSVKWHRKNIRKKLGLTNHSSNLFTYLKALSK